MNFGLFSRMAHQVSSGVGVRYTSIVGLKVKVFSDGSNRFAAIEQNTRTKSNWAKLAQEGHEVVQFKNISNNKYVAVAVDGRVKPYRSGV